MLAASYFLPFNGDWEVETRGGGTCAVRYKGSEDEEEIVIPRTIKKGWRLYEVTALSSYAFSGCEKLTDIEIPDSVTDIYDGAFCGCSSLTEIELPDGLTEIENWAFAHCTGLRSIKIPESVTEITTYTFEGCSNLTVILPEDLSYSY